MTAKTYTFDVHGDHVMRELNERPSKKATPPVGVRIVQENDMRERDPYRRNVVYILVPDVFGNLEPLLDGETGEPCDFAREFGDPRQWMRDRTKEVQVIVERVGNMCQKMFRARVTV